MVLYFKDIPDTTNKKVDLIMLNDLHAKNPLLAYNITGKHDILINYDRDRYEAFTHRSYSD